MKNGDKKSCCISFSADIAMENTNMIVNFVLCAPFNGFFNFLFCFLSFPEEITNFVKFRNFANFGEFTVKLGNFVQFGYFENFCN